AVGLRRGGRAFRAADFLATFFLAFLTRVTFRFAVFFATLFFFFFLLTRASSSACSKGGRSYNCDVDESRRGTGRRVLPSVRPHCRDSAARAHAPKPLAPYDSGRGDSRERAARGFPNCAALGIELPAGGIRRASLSGPGISVHSRRDLHSPCSRRPGGPGVCRGNSRGWPPKNQNC